MAEQDEREVAAMKARIAELESGRATSTKPYRSLGCGGMLAICALVAIGLWALSKTTRTPIPEAPPAADRCDPNFAAAKYEALRREGILSGEEISARADGMVIIIRPWVLHSMGYERQKAIAAIADCAVAGRGKHLVAVRLRTTQAGPDMALFEASDLLKLRAEGLAGIPYPAKTKRRGGGEP